MTLPIAVPVPPRPFRATASLLALLVFAALSAGGCAASYVTPGRGAP